MKDNKIIMFLGFIFIILLGFGILTHTTNKVEEEPTISEYTQTTDVALMTNDAVPLEGTCIWHLDVASTDVDRFKIDLIISRTIQKSIAKYSYKDLLNNSISIFSDIKERVEDCVFSIQPYGFMVCSLSINKPENVILK
jgi:hypothetical protein